jgi:small conductance mechanosensitive channel
MGLILLLGSAGRRTFRYFYIHAILAAICTSLVLPAQAQVPIPGGAAAPASPSSSVLGIRQQGLYVTAPIQVDGQPVIRIAALAKGATLPIDTRVLLVQNAIAQVLALDPDRHTTLYDPNTFKIKIAREGSQYSLSATDAKHSDGIDIVTVTSSDASAFGLSEHDLGEQWQGQLQHALVTALSKREPANIRSNIVRVSRAAAILGAITIAALIVLLLIRREMRRLHKQSEERHESMERSTQETAAQSGDAADKSRRKTLALGMRAAAPDQRLRRLSLYSGAIVWGVTLMWAVALVYALFLFPATTATGQFVVGAAGKILVVWIIAGIVDRGLELMIVHASDMYAHRGTTSEERARHALRAPTISRAIGGFKTAAVFFIAILVTLSQLNIPIASVVTIGGIAALAIGFAAQTLVKDVLNGLLVLMEDHYVVGDYVMIGDYNGVVEGLSLRRLQLRDGRGYLITIPHSSVTQVVNASRNWSRIDFRIAVDPGTDLKAAIQTVRETFDGVAADPAWRNAILEPLEWIGVERVANTGVVLRASVRTAPMRQFDVHRELNQRVVEAFKREKIGLGIDPLTLPVPPPQASPDPM